MSKQSYVTFVHHFFTNVIFCSTPTNQVTAVFVQRVGPRAIELYQNYIDYLEEIVIYNLKRELAEALVRLEL
jgi:hypothetical protein